MAIETLPIRSKALFDPTKSNGMTFEQWAAQAGDTDAMPSLAPGQIDDSVAGRVATITSQDSDLMKLARADGAKLAQRRGLLNSSMASNAAQDAVLRAAFPIASQDAAQAFQKNRDSRNFEFGMVSQDFGQQWQSGENQLNRALQERLTLADIASREGMAAAGRELELQMQANGLAAADRQQIRDIASREGMAAADRALQETLTKAQISSAERIAAGNRSAQMSIAQMEIAGRQASDMARYGFERDLALMQIDATKASQIRDIEYREGQAAADRALQSTLQEREINYQNMNRSLDRDIQTRLANWNLDSSERMSAMSSVYNFENLYQSTIANINANTYLDATQRTDQLSSAKSLRDRQLNLVEQLYNVQLDWGQPTATGTMGPTARQANQSITNLYTTYLGYQPDQAGLDYWSNQLMSGANLADIEAQFRAAGNRAA